MYLKKRKSLQHHIRLPMFLAYDQKCVNLKREIKCTVKKTLEKHITMIFLIFTLKKKQKIIILSEAWTFQQCGKKNTTIRINCQMGKMVKTRLT
jgi:hypothetical protein